MMVDFRLFRDRLVRVRLHDGSRYFGRFHAILDEGAPAPGLWLTDWFREHVLGLDLIAEIELVPSSGARVMAA